MHERARPAPLQAPHRLSQTGYGHDHIVVCHPRRGTSPTTVPTRHMAHCLQHAKTIPGLWPLLDISLGLWPSWISLSTNCTKGQRSHRPRRWRHSSIISQWCAYPSSQHVAASARSRAALCVRRCRFRYALPLQARPRWSFILERLSPGSDWWPGSILTTASDVVTIWGRVSE